MSIRGLLCAAALLGVTPAAVMAQDAPPESAETVTQWRVRAAPGMDALLMLGAASGDILQAEYYGETIEFLRAEMSPEGLAALDRLDQAMRVERGILTGPSFAYFFSAGPLDSIDDVIASAADPDRYLRPGLEGSPHWDEERYEGAMSLMPDVLIALRALKDVGFEDWYTAQMMPIIEAAIADNLAAVSGHDVIPEQARLLGRELDPGIEILIVRFAQPYGIRITGQRFVAYHGWEGAIQLRVAAHEIFHPPFDIRDDGLWSRLAELEADPWMVSIVENHDPAFGYNTFRGVVNEDSTQALDQIVAERLGFARDPAHRWSHSDGGMHMFAAALYHAMKEDGFDERGGTYSDWLKSALDRGMLTPDEVRRRAAEIVSPDAVQHWYDVAAAIE